MACKWHIHLSRYVSDYIMLQRCSEELLHLKSLWDTVGTVMFTFNDWYKTPWDKIDVEFLMEETKKLAKEVKMLNKAVRNYDVFRMLEEALKAMMTSLPLVQVGCEKPVQHESALAYLYLERINRLGFLRERDGQLQE